MKAQCSGCSQLKFIQNKKHNLCGDCVYKQNHGGKSREEVYAERAMNKPKKTYTLQRKPFINNRENFFQDEESLKNEINQNAAEQREKEEQGFGNVEGLLNTRTYRIDENTINHRTFVKWNKSKSKKSKKPIKQISAKQAEINRAYALTCADMDYVEEKVCSGCLRYQGGDIRLSHSHIISREDCKRIGRIDLISDRENITYHCMDFGENSDSCHKKWENPTKRHQLADYEKNIEYIKSIDEGLFLKYQSQR